MKTRSTSSKFSPTSRSGLWCRWLICSGAVSAGAGMALSSREGQAAALGASLIVLGSCLNLLVVLSRGGEPMLGEKFSLPISKVLIALAVGIGIGAMAGWFWVG